MNNVYFELIGTDQLSPRDAESQETVHDRTANTIQSTRTESNALPWTGMPILGLTAIPWFGIRSKEKR